MSVNISKTAKIFLDANINILWKFQVLIVINFWKKSILFYCLTLKITVDKYNFRWMLILGISMHYVFEILFLILGYL